MTYAYVLESAHELRALAILLRARHVAGAVEPIVRAVVERSGRVNWILEGGGSKEGRDASSRGFDYLDVRRRTIRACLEYLACLQHTAKTEEALGPTQLGAEMDERLRNDFGLIGQWFAVGPPEAESARLASDRVPTISQVSIGGERLRPSRSLRAERAGERRASPGALLRPLQECKCAIKELAGSAYGVGPSPAQLAGVRSRDRSWRVRSRPGRSSEPPSTLGTASC